MAQSSTDRTPRATPASVDTRYRPGGYPRLGLAPLGVSFSPTSSPATGRRLERLERRYATPLFRAHGFAALTPHQANELASVYVALRQWFPGATIDRLNVAWTPSPARHKFRGLLGLALCRDDMGTIRELAYELDEPRILKVLARAHEVADPDTVRQARRELRRATRSDAIFAHDINQLDARAHATLALSECITHPICAAALENQRRDATGEVAIATSESTYLLVHEFAHVVETALSDLTSDDMSRVWSTLDDVLLRREDGRWLLSDYRLAQTGLRRSDARLLNYPYNYPTATTRPGVRDAVRKVVGAEVSSVLGSYAAKDRWELFAEALTYSFIARDPALRARLAPLQRTLRDLGLEVRRRSAVR